MDKPKITEGMRARLREPFPGEAVTRHPTKKFLSTIKAIYIVERINDVFGIGRWDFNSEVVKHSEVGEGYVLISGTFVFLDYDVRVPVQYGGHKTVGTNVELADGYKSAVTDCMSKCASYLEIGIDVFKGKIGNKNHTVVPKRNKSDVPKAAIRTPVAISAAETWEEFCYRNKLGESKINELEDYIAESAKSLGMDAKSLKDSAVKAGDLEDMLEAVMSGKKDEPANEPAKANWWDSTKHWSFRINNTLKELVLFGFGGEAGDSKACIDNPDAQFVLKAALPETKKALVKKFDKMFGVGAFKEFTNK